MTLEIPAEPRARDRRHLPLRPPSDVFGLFPVGVVAGAAVAELDRRPRRARRLRHAVRFRVRREEQMMHEAFGDAYRAYAARTPRLVPGVF